MAPDPNGTNPGMYTVAPFLNYDGAGNPSGGQTGSGSNYQRRFAPIGQGFLINANANGSVSILNSHRRYIVEGAANNSQFRNPIGNDSIQSRNPISYVRLYTIFGTSHFRDMVLAFHPDSTTGFDRGLDATHPMDATSDAYMPIGDSPDAYMKLVIQTRPFIAGEMIPINFILDRQFKFTVQAVEWVNIPNHAYLWDVVGHTRKRITGGDKAEQMLPAGHYEDRFFIVFEPIDDANRSPIEVIEEVKESIGFFQNNPNRQLEISNPEGHEILLFGLYDMTGRLILDKSNLGNNITYDFSTANISDGVYLVNLLTVNNIALRHKIIIKN